MKFKINLIFLVIGLVSTTCFGQVKGWKLTSTEPNSFQLSLEKSDPRDGKGSGHLKSTTKTDAQAKAVQVSLADKFKGKKVRLTGFHKIKDVTKGAGMFMRVDQVSCQSFVAEDDFSKRVIKGTMGWLKFNIDIDIPKEASIMTYGVQLDGEGEVWFDNFAFEIISKDVKNTGMEGKVDIIPAEPINLGYQE